MKPKRKMSNELSSRCSEILKLKQELLYKNNYIRKVNRDRRELLNEWERLFAFKSFATETVDYMKQEGEKMTVVALNQRNHIAELENSIMNNSKDTEAKMAEFEREKLKLKQEIEKLNELVQRQRKNITETQNSSKSKNDKIKMLSSEKKMLREQIQKLEERNAALIRDKEELATENLQLNEKVADLVAQPTSKSQAELECNICLDECVEDCWIFAPCGHYACGTCSRQLTNCQTCRVKITSKIKLFL